MEAEIKAMGPSEWGMLIILSILWGGSFFFVGVAVKALPPLTIVSLRVSLASLTLLAVVHFLGYKLPKKREIWLAFLGMCLLNNVVPFSLIVWGQTQIASGLASILNATTPLFTVIVAHFFTQDEKINAKKIFGVTVGFTGVAIMLGYNTVTGIGGSVFGQLAVLAAAISYAFAGIYGRRFRQTWYKNNRDGNRSGNLFRPYSYPDCSTVRKTVHLVSTRYRCLAVHYWFGSYFDCSCLYSVFSHTCNSRCH